MMFTSPLLVVLLSVVVSSVTPKCTTTDENGMLDGTEGEVSTTDSDYLSSTSGDESDKLCGKEGEEWKEEYFQRYTLEFHNGRLRAPRNLSLLEYSCDLEKLADQAVDGCSTKSPQDVPDYYILFKH
ncbi:hypothetical protein KIN20_027734 [Parelaphostrongylus tenuis]|uniref:Uncharacterized protein n=1 Tax=Parelaphostrongylus tenuis TaxID=148309 RepID=A0AAD5WE41_PARTN|nr:hypothetical protein KIN20_027734 [Parelaphostrongylus tenuis]